MATKFCRDCGDYRPVEEFTKNARSRDGLAFYCRKHLAERSLKSREARRSKPRVQRRPPADLVIPDGHKWCADCGQVLPLADFVRTVATLTGYGAYCRPCHNARSRKSREKIGESRTYHLTRRYGITAAEADFLLAAQDGLCAVCKSAPAVHVDHDHVTGAVRALLCFNCNGGLGQFKDDPDVLRAAAEYVEFHRTRRAAANGPTAPTRPGAPPVGSKAGPNRRRLHPGACARVRAKYELREADG